MKTKNSPSPMAKWLALAAAIAIPLAAATASAQTQTQGQSQSQPTATDTAEQPPLPAGRPSPQEMLDALGISGYADPWIVRPGQSVEIMASTKDPQFEATLVRVIHGDADPLGPGIKVEALENPANGQHEGRYQTLPLGSYVKIEDDRSLSLDGSFTLTAWVAPTTIPGSDLNPMAGPSTPVGTPRPQGILTKWSQGSGTGYGLVIDEKGRLALWIAGAEDKAARVSTDVAMRPWTPGFNTWEVGGAEAGSPIMANESGWYFVAASYNAQTGQVQLYQQPVRRLPDNTATVVSERVEITGLTNADCPVLIAAYWPGAETGQCGEWPVGFLNGKIDNPRVYGRALSREEIQAIRECGATRPAAIASWNFSERISSREIVDASAVAGRANGVTVNNPVRAVTGHDWQAGTMNWTHAPGQYGGIYFHQDDLGDSRWEPSVRFETPEDARSGYYAAKLQAGEDTYYVPFFVVPKRGTHRSNIAFLVPTFSYLAYGSTGGMWNTWMSMYDVHADGSGVVYSSHLRPLTDQRVMATGPNGEGVPWAYDADTHIVDWLHRAGQVPAVR